MRVESDEISQYLGSPRFTEEMALQPSGGSTLIGIPAPAVKFLGYEVGERREVEVYDDGVFIPAEVPGDE